LSFCIKCGRKVPEKANFCSYCGTSVASSRSAPSIPEIKVYRNPKGRAFKFLFDFIKDNFSSQEFSVEDLPDVNEAFVREVNQAMEKSGIFWMGPGENKQAKIEILVELSKAGLLNYRRVKEEFRDENGKPLPYQPIEKVLYNLTEEAKRTRVILGDLPGKN
jgi:hypothetical protein